MKKVIFVGGTAYSGSTFFDMTLANDPEGFSCGEVYALFNPFRAHHVRPLCGCGDAQCQIWPRVLAAGEERLYQTIFDLYPAVDFVVDSSKDPFWIARQDARLRRLGFETKHIVIWKTPLELAASCRKRGQMDQWERSWVNYFRLYHTMVSDWRSVPYADYTQDARVLARVCETLEIPYFEGKESYWQKEHHLLFGNDSARVHLESGGSQQRTPWKPVRESPDDKPALRTVYYRPVEDEQLEQVVTERVEASPYIQGLIEMLDARDVRNPNVRLETTFDNLKMSPQEVQLRRLKQAVTYRVGRLRFK